jgi:hypothetical protein
MTFGNVGETAWRDSGSLLAMTISAADRAGNGIHLHDAGTGALRVLDSSNRHRPRVASLTHRMLVMRGKTNEKKTVRRTSPSRGPVSARPRKNT